MRVIRNVLWIALFLGVLPLILAYAGMVTAEMTGCTIGVHVPQPCIVFGTDIGPTLLTLVMMHWLALITLPLAGIALIGLVIMGVIALIRRVRG